MTAVTLARKAFAVLSGAVLLMGLASCGPEKEKKGQPPVSKSGTLPWEPPPPATGPMSGMPREPRR